MDEKLIDLREECSLTYQEPHETILSAARPIVADILREDVSQHTLRMEGN